MPKNLRGNPSSVRVESRPDRFMPLPDVQRLAHELHVHQVELETQNEELRRTQLDLAAARDRFIDLYDFAPVGYFTLNRQGVVIEVNLTGAAMLGEERKLLLKRRFARFIKPSDNACWQQHLLDALQHDDVRRIELPVQPRRGALFQGQLDCLRVVPEEATPTLRVTLTDITPRKQAEIERQVAATALEAGEAERRRLARALHEELGQRLSALKMDLASLHPILDASGQVRRLPEMLDTLDEVLAMVRRMAADLRPLMLDDLGLNAAVDWMAHDWARRRGVHVTLSLDEPEPPMGERHSIAVYRLLQRMLDHLAQHAHATDVHIDTRHRLSEFKLTVRETGSGWPMPDNRHAKAGVGATEATDCLAQQARLLGGQLTFDSAPATGSRFTLRLPLPNAAAHPA